MTKAGKTTAAAETGSGTGLVERNKENSFLDVDWIISELIAHGKQESKIVEGKKTPSPSKGDKSPPESVERPYSTRQKRNSIVAGKVRDRRG